MKSPGRLPMFGWSLGGGCAFLASYFLPATAGWWAYAVATIVMLVFGLVRGGWISAAVWGAALLIASLIGSLTTVDSVVFRGAFILALAGAMAGVAEPADGRHRILSGFAWAAALPIGLYAGIAVTIFLDQPLDLLFDRGFVAGRFSGGAIGAAIAFLIGETVASLSVKTPLTIRH